MDRGLKLIYPDRCVVCGAAVRPGVALCGDCAGEFLPDPDTVFCPYCALPQSECSCGRAFAFDLTFAPVRFVGRARDSVLRCKYRPERDLCAGFAAVMAEFVAPRLRYEVFDLVASVPSWAERTEEKGFDQAELIARSFAEMIGKPYAPLLVRTRPAPPQKRLDADQRWANMRGAFDLVPDALIENRRVILVDDVRTTGATLDECAAVLKVFGASAVVCAVFAAGGMGPRDDYDPPPLPDETLGLIRPDFRQYY